MRENNRQPASRKNESDFEASQSIFLYLSPCLTLLFCCVIRDGLVCASYVGKGGFEHFLEVNFEEEPTIHPFFDDSLNPAGINEKLAAYFGVPIEPRKTLRAG